MGKVKHRGSHSGIEAKKHLGQHFLNDENVAISTAELIEGEDLDQVIEIGPGTGVLTEHLYKYWGDKLLCVELDSESVTYLNSADWAQGLNLWEGDFLQLDVSQFEGKKIAVIGNYPYNISTQIAFKILEENWNVVLFAGMFQKEVAERFCAVHGNKTYGVTSVLLQSYFDCEVSFLVPPESFIPPPSVDSAVMIAKRTHYEDLPEWKFLRQVVKQAFSQRRKTLSNSLKSMIMQYPKFQLPEEWKTLRAEALSVTDFHALSRAYRDATR